ncbi:DUF2497 domain-containing protein [Erythrobacter rubeus]|uniref:DUF2497 domain-containing protein n=1 Tax=Erythrobacter rubeus TaxID=2760803 RepID=A0ABR8KR56_9SPHN|nr:DUF2497 domain-containing protein [Erythrobacter rubeus]MBD2843190.1 DUF2497 domain-containing protein [Erythrobacter rubeus]
MAQSESSVEEILESIKKVIARDNRESAFEVRRMREEEAERSDQVPGEIDGDEVLDLSDMEIEEEIAGPETGDVPPTEPGEDGVDPEDTPLITDEVRGAMQDNLAALAMLAEPGARPQIVRSGETSLEGLTRELLRPMLAEWLDKNLPGMVDKLVRAEIARIAGKKR